MSSGLSCEATSKPTGKIKLVVARDPVSKRPGIRPPMKIAGLAFIIYLATHMSARSAAFIIDPDGNKVRVDKRKT